jgi:SAM-dependent methyltransferase
MELRTAPPLAAGQCWDAARYARDAGFVPALGEAVFDLLAPLAGERILDLGCGDGVLTARLSSTGAEVIGLDASPELVAAAVARGIDARIGDGHHLQFDREFDAVFSNAALHWMREPKRVVAGVARALKPGGRFVAEFGGHGNVAAIVTAVLAALRLHGVADSGFRWFFPTADEYAALLREHGFAVECITLFARPTALPAGMETWLSTFADPFLGHADASTQQNIIDDAVALLAPSLRDHQGLWHADYVRLKFVARLSDTTHTSSSANA